MTIGICSGYFQRLHDGHKKYIRTAMDLFEYVIIIINNDIQQKKKYENFENIRSSQEISDEIFEQSIPWGKFRIITSIDCDESVCETLKLIRSLYPSASLYFCKDGDRNKKNIPETKVLRKARIKYINFLNPKIDSAAEIMKKENDCEIQNIK